VEYSIAARNFGMGFWHDVLMSGSDEPERELLGQRLCGKFFQDVKKRDG
jgi:hypothetical protein